MTNEEAIKKLDSIKGNYIQWMGMPDDRCEALDLAVSALEKQIPKRVFANSKREFTNEDYKGIRDTRYYCPCCKRPTKQTVTYCDKCGQKLLFPAFHWTMYDGENPQIRTMTWGEENDRAD